MQWLIDLIFAFAHWLQTTPLAAFSVWIANTPLGVSINQNSWITPTTQSIHILAIALTFSAVLMINLRIFQLSGQGHSMVEVQRRYTPWIWGGLLVLAATGVILVIAEPARELLDPLFWIKLALIAVLALGTLWFQHSVQRNAAFWERLPGGFAAVRLGAVAVIVVWCVVMVLGRWIAYLGI